MKRYTLREALAAAQVAEVRRYTDGTDGAVVYVDEGPALVGVIGLGIFASGLPEPGDYLVRCGDSYESFSPRTVFEAGYMEVLEV